MSEPEDTYTPATTVSGEPLSIEPGTDEWHLLIAMRAARHDQNEGDAAEALMRLSECLGAALPNALRMSWQQDEIERTYARSEIIAGLDWLRSAGIAPILLGQAVMALEELDRGNIMPVLQRPKGKGKGQVSDLSTLWWKAIAVRAADEVTKFEPTTEGKDVVLKKFGFRRTTIETYRKAIEVGPSEFRHPVSYFLSFGDTPPQEVLSLARTNLPTKKNKQRT